MKYLEKFEDFKTRKEIEELDIFDFNNIPMSELDKAYIDYEPLYDTVDWYSVDEDNLYEERKNNTTGIQSAVDVVSRAINQLKMSEFQIKAKSPNGVEYIEVDGQRVDAAVIPVDMIKDGTNIVAYMGRDAREVPVERL